MLNSKYQKLNITTSNTSAKVYVNKDFAGQGKVVPVKLERNFKVQQLRVEQEGYKPEYKVALQSKRSPLYILSWLPLGSVFVVPTYGIFSLMIPYLDMGAKSFNYKKDDINIKPASNIIARKENNKFIYLESTSFNVGKEDLVFKSYRNHEDYYKGKKETSSTKGKSDIKLDNTIFSDALTDVLTKYGYTDTTRSILRNRTNTLYMSAEVKNLQFVDLFNYKRKRAQSYSIGEATIDWTFYDVYGQKKYQKTITSKSGEFSPDFYEEPQDFVVNILEDAITASFFEVLKAKEVQTLLNEEVKEKPAYQPLAIKKSNVSSLVKTIADAQNATVTIASKDGHGSGIVINNEGYILTNFHVIANQKDNLKVILKGGEKLTCNVVRVNEFADLALLKVDKELTSSFDLPDVSDYTPGMDVFAIGTPKSIELGQTLSKGIISGIRNDKESEWIQTDVSINPGNSGGALIDKNGKLIGIVNSKVTGFGVEGIAFCIPAYKVTQFLALSYE
ncbi:S1C family serine protease [Botryobacter ruber]|uniref:S1C family serine protease n=1 Tax=Botryobacter ruber TaxID=2171629 RepID=UPI0013E3429E|nr:trypsin-like peptidase domain-containing protein [Botryobacter ruber]